MIRVVVVAGVVWVLLGLASLGFAHSAHEDPHLQPTSLHDQNLHTTDGDADEEELSDHLAVEVRGGEGKARELAEKYGLHYLGQVFETPPVYHLHTPPRSTGRSRRHTPVTLVDALAQEPGVDWVDQQRSLVRDKRIPRIPDSHRFEWSSLPHNAKRIFTQATQPLGQQQQQEAILKGVQGLRIQSSDAHRNEFELPDTHTSGSTGNRINEEDEALEEKLIDRLSNYKRQDDDPERNFYEIPQTPSDPRGATVANLTRIPLSRSIGYSVQKAKTNFGRDYFRRSFQVADERIEDTQGKTTPAATEGTAVGEEGSEYIAWLENLFKTTLEFNDPFYGDQWYLHNTGQLGRSGYDLNVTWAWMAGYTGRGLTLSVLDDGIQTTNLDITANYIPDISYSVVRDGAPLDDPSPRLDPTFSNSHGTYCAAVMVAVQNNSFCGVGVAYEARVGGVRIVDGPVTDIQEATALSRHLEHVDVFSASWGPTDNGATVEGPGKLASQAFLEGISKGRLGKGVIYVWASGNGGQEGDNCNLDGYASSIYTLSVSALTDIGTSPFYEEPCASTLGGVFVGGEHSLQAAIQRRREHRKKIRVIVPELDGHCSETFQGTSAAAPLMAGIVALTLQANPMLTWRDMQHLVVQAATPTREALQEPGWHTNAIGKKFHLLQGFGAVNGGEMVEASLQWQNVGPQQQFTLTMLDGSMPFLPYEWLNTTQVFFNSSHVTNLRSVEHVVANISIAHPQRGLLTIFIISPSGTTSQVLTHRPKDKSKAGFKSWGFMSVHFWGETPLGHWTVAIKDDSGSKGYLQKMHLTVYGA